MGGIFLLPIVTHVRKSVRRPNGRTQTLLRSLEPIHLCLLHAAARFLLLRPQEIFNWLYVVEETEEDVWEGGKLAWQVKYQHADLDSKEGTEELSPASNISTTPMAALSRLRHRLEVIFHTHHSLHHHSLNYKFPNVLVVEP